MNNEGVRRADVFYTNPQLKPYSSRMNRSGF